LITMEPGTAVGMGAASRERGVPFECRTRARWVDILAERPSLKVWALKIEAIKYFKGKIEYLYFKMLRK
jgi:hypothetical protein